MAISGDMPLVVSAVGALRYRDPTTAATRALDAAASTDVINVTEAGRLLGILVHVTVAPTGTPTMRLEIVVDGGTQENITVYSASNTWAAFFSRLISVVRGSGLNGDAIADGFLLQMNCPYESSLIVRANCTGAGSAGSVDVYGIRATKQ